ncbi:uncharacterized protein SCHCODRAFT_02736233, partial [Schizophyllum commune H4-8]|uniref:uncharacterized protein n=1 Tax=Schizophyllum commune (strain H4-8 / FGSC 9210) TaxID=578458 RepID=UPI00216075BC
GGLCTGRRSDVHFAAFPAARRPSIVSSGVGKPASDTWGLCAPSTKSAWRSAPARNYAAVPTTFVFWVFGTAHEKSSSMTRFSENAVATCWPIYVR